MASEIELKLNVPPTMLHALSRAAWLRRLAQAPVRQRKLVSVYFDTPDRSLREEGLGLRARKSGERHVQTVKRGEGLSRQEWEREIEGDAPERRLSLHTALKPFTAKKQWRKLRPVFETDVRRLSLPLRYGSSAIELALDHGVVKAGADHRAISEVELELKDGEVADLAGLAAEIARRGRVRLELRSKPERGYALADHRLEDHVGATAIGLDGRMTAEDGFRAIGFSCPQHLAANRAAVLAGDPEGVHQMRVGLRRLRAALSLFKGLIVGREFEAIKKDLKWLSGELGPARDFDVFVKNTIVPLHKRPPAGLKALEADLEARRRKGFARASRLVRSERYRRILLRTGLWLTGGNWATIPDKLRHSLRQRALKDMAAEILSARTAKLAKKLKKLNELDARHRHKLRIACKKLRYAVGFFDSLFPRHKRFSAVLKKLQSALGRLNDIRVHEQFARKAVRGKARLPRGAYALGVATGAERSARKSCLAAADKAGHRLRKQSDFWVEQA